LAQLEEAEVAFLDDLYRRGGPQLQTRAAQLATLQAALRGGGTRFSQDQQEDVVPALAHSPQVCVCSSLATARLWSASPGATRSWSVPAQPLNAAPVATPIAQIICYAFRSASGQSGTVGLERVLLCWTHA
jgi:hypothetical protein